MLTLLLCIEIFIWLHTDDLDRQKLRTGGACGWLSRHRCVRTILSVPPKSFTLSSLELGKNLVHPPDRSTAVGVITFHLGDYRVECSDFVYKIDRFAMICSSSSPTHDRALGYIPLSPSQLPYFATQSCLPAILPCTHIIHLSKCLKC